MEIRPAQATETAGLKEFILSHGINSWNYLSDEELSHHLEALRSGEVLAFVAEEEDRIVGVATCGVGHRFGHYKDDADSGSMHGIISEVVVAEEWCRRGIGTELMRHCCIQLRAKDITRIYVERHEENKASAGMMAKAGFQVIDTFHDPDRRSCGSLNTSVSRFDWTHPNTP